MKKIKSIILTLALLVLSSSPFSAKEISVGEAMSLAAGFQTTSKVLKNRQELPLKHVYTEKLQDLNCVYVFSRGAGNGYVVVAGDDRVQTPVLGYADSGNFDAENIPENMKWWLGEYARQIQYMNQHPVAVKVKPAAAKIDKEVAPIMKSKWNQGYPYNLHCPELNGKLCYVGCVATATAQVMYHHKFPQVGTGSITYNWEKGGKTITEDISKHPFDWANMLDVYSSFESTDHIHAVAELCYMAGVTAQMNYGTDASGTFSELVSPALYKYFGYDDAMVCMHREYYTSEEWDALIRQEIDANRPVLYSGANLTTGHAFVLDGYNKGGYFHVNWGWGGTSDGYFRSLALDPASQGIGGSDAGYNYGQTATLGIQPETPETKHIFQVLQNGDFSTPSTTATKGNRVKFEFTKNVYTESVKDKEVFNIGVGFYNEKNELAYEFYYDQAFEILRNNSYTGCYVSPVIPNLPDGNYTVRPLFKTSELTTMPILSPVNRSGKIYMNVKGNKLTFANEGQILITAENITTKGNLNTKSMYSISADFKNTVRDTYYGRLMALFFDGTTGQIHQVLGAKNVELKKNEEVSLRFEDELTIQPGPWIMALCDEGYNVLYSKNVTVGEELPAVSVTAELVNVPATMAVYSMQDVTFKLTNNSQTDFYDKILTAFVDGNVIVQFFSEEVYEVPAGKTVEFTVHSMVNVPNVNVTLMLAVLNKNFMLLSQGDVKIQYSDVPLLYASDKPVLTGYSDYDIAADCAVFDKPEIGYTQSIRNLGADMSGTLNLNLFQMMGDVPIFVTGVEVPVSVNFSQYFNVEQTLKGMTLEDGEKYMCELYMQDNETPVDEEKTRAYFIYRTDASVDAVESISLSVYPNPVTDVLNISFAAPVVSVKLYSMQGACVMAAEGVSELNVSELLPATYIAVIVTEDGETTTQKIVKK